MSAEPGPVVGTVQQHAATGVELKLLDDAAELRAAAGLLAQVWGRPTARPPVEAALLVALAHTGNYVSGAFLDGRLVGASAGWFASPAALSLHSHITGILADAAGRGLGRALKLHQRDWALERGLETITWTFDPLVARNAHLNLAVLGVDVLEYLPDLYGPMDDDLNLGQPSDRLLVSWRLRGAGPRRPPAMPAPAAIALVDAVPTAVVQQLPGTGECTLAVPPDIEGLRRANPQLAVAWRSAQREAFSVLLDHGWSVTGFDRTEGFRLARHSPEPLQ